MLVASLEDSLPELLLCTSVLVASLEASLPVLLVC